jgi:hypothetical protein
MAYGSKHKIHLITCAPVSPRAPGSQRSACSLSPSTRHVRRAKPLSAGVAGGRGGAHTGGGKGHLHFLLCCRCCQACGKSFFCQRLGATAYGLDGSGGSLGRWGQSPPTTFSPCGRKRPSPDALCVVRREREGLWEATPSLRRLFGQARQGNGPPPPAPQSRGDAAPPYRFCLCEDRPRREYSRREESAKGQPVPGAPPPLSHDAASASHRHHSVLYTSNAGPSQVENAPHSTLTPGPSSARVGSLTWSSLVPGRSLRFETALGGNPRSPRPRAGSSSPASHKTPSRTATRHCSHCLCAASIDAPSPGWPLVRSAAGHDVPLPTPHAAHAAPGHAPTHAANAEADHAGSANRPTAAVRRVVQGAGSRAPAAPPGSSASP